MNCTFKLINNEWVCTICGRTVKNYGKEPVACCLSKSASVQKTFPSPFEQIRNYTRAIINHAADGFKSAEDSMVEKRLAVCKTCERYDIATGSCGICGCRCNAGKYAIINKLRMNSEKCPLGKWE